MITGSFNVSRADKIHSALETYCDAWNAYDHADEVGEPSGRLMAAIGDAQAELGSLLGTLIERPVRGAYDHVLGAKCCNGLILRRA